MLPRLLARIADIETTQGPPAPRAAQPWLRILAGVVLFPGFWVSVVLAVAAILPATFPRLQLLVQLTAILPAGALAWLAVRRAPALLLAILIPVLLALYFIALNLMANLPGRA